MGLVVKPLKPYTGPYSVATTDLELPVSSPSSFGHATLRKTGQPALQLDTILVTLFYPANPHRYGSGEKQHWVQRPLGETASGYARFLGKPVFVVKSLFFLFARNVRLPVEGDRPLAFKLDGKAAPMAGEKTDEKARMAHDSTETLVGDDMAQGEFPLVIFSHGLSGTRTTYSQWCGEIASRGYVVAAIEHRDGSGPISVVRLEDGKKRVVDYIKAEEHLDFPAPHPPVTALQFRSSQLRMRLAEVEEVLTLVRRLNDGEGAAIAAENRRKDYGGEGVVGKWLAGWKGRIAMDELVMAGHSFGGATTIQVLRAGATHFPFVRGIALDPWADPIPPAPSSPSLSSPTRTSTRASDPAPTAAPSEDGEKSDVPLDIKVPLLVINSESFTLWKVHYKLVRGIVEAIEGGKGWLMTMIGSIHTTFSDLPLLVPSMAKRSGARVPAPLATSRIVEACREFLDGEGARGEVLGMEVREGDEQGARPGEGKKDGETPMEGEVGSFRMHVRGTEGA
ncbi:hypothetical protein JCM10207_004935 [Rhodosporidiobolus poonsookiae]